MQMIDCCCQLLVSKLETFYTITFNLQIDMKSNFAYYKSRKDPVPDISTGPEEKNQKGEVRIACLTFWGETDN